MSDLVPIAYGLSIATIVIFGAGALLISRRRQAVREANTEFFLTARHTVPEGTIAWSFFASGVGAWVIFSMPAYAMSAGIIGLVAYSVACGLPIVLIAHVGSILHRKYPGVMSLGDFVQWRFGTLPTIFVTLIMILNMSIGLCAEYTSIGNLMEFVIGGPRLPIILVVAIVTAAYTSVGGLLVSILTDVAQGIFGVALLVIMYIYVAVTFRPESLPTPLPEELGPNYWGYAAIAAMPISMTCATMFSDGPWQRIFAAADDRALKRGSLWGALGLVVVCFLYGFGGFLAMWAGFPMSSPDGSTAFFDLLTAGQATAPVWITVLAALATVTMNEGCVDTYQNAITNTISARFFRGKSVWYPRAMVWIINIPIVFVSLKGYNIIQLFLIGNLIATMCTVPLLMGLIRSLEGYITGWSMLFGNFTGFWSIAIFGMVKTGGSLMDGLQYTFVDYYDWPSFLLPLIFSGLGVLLAAFVEGLIRKACGFAYPVPMNMPPESGFRDDDSTLSSGSTEAPSTSTYPQDGKALVEDVDRK